MRKSLISLILIFIVLVVLFGAYYLINKGEENTIKIDDDKNTDSSLPVYPEEIYQIRQGESLRFYSNGCSASIYFGIGSKDSATNKISARFSYAPGAGFDIVENEEKIIPSEGLIWYKNVSKPFEGVCETEINQLDKKQITIRADKLDMVTQDYSGGEQITFFEGKFTVKYN